MRDFCPATGKIKFETFDLARTVGRKRGKNNGRRDVYRCRQCREFHLGRHHGATIDSKQRAKMNFGLVRAQ